MIYEKFSLSYTEKYKHYTQEALEDNPCPSKTEVRKLTNLSFIEKRYTMLVREAYEKKISITRASELLDIPILQMRSLISSWL